MNEKLKHGHYCTVTEEQAIELLVIEGDFLRPEEYVAGFFSGEYGEVCMRFDLLERACILSPSHHWDRVEKIDFEDFKQRLINTVK